MSTSRILRTVLPFALTLPLSAQTPISGSLADGNGGPLLAGVVYHATASISVAAGQALTIEPGAVVKFAAAAWLDVSGRVVVAGTAAQPVVLTDIDDDSAGGDTNNNGNVPPVPGRWGSVIVRGGGTLDATQLEVRHAGHQSSGAVQVEAQGSLSWHGGVVRGNTNLDGLHFGATLPAALQLRQVHFTGMRRVGPVPLPFVPGLVGNTASGNAQHDVLELAGWLNNVHTLASGTTTIGPQNLISGVLRSNGFTVGPAATLEFDAGCVVKLYGGFTRGLPEGAIMVAGALRCRGTANQPVVFTSWDDDAFGGDSNRDGPTNPTSGSWRRVQLEPGAGNSVLDHVQFRFGGFQGAQAIVQCDATLRHCVSHGSFSNGLDLLESPVRPHITDLLVTNCASRAVTGLRWDSLRRFQRVQCSGNLVNAVCVTSDIVDADCVVAEHNLPRGAVVVERDPVFTASSSLTLEAGVIVKSALTTVFSVEDGRFVARGTAAKPVVFTTWTDDAMGGDSDPSGPTSGFPGAWYGLYVSGTTPMSLQHLRVRFGGASGAHALWLANPALTARALHVESAWRTGIMVAAVAGPVVNCLVHDCYRGIQLDGGNTDVLHATVAFNTFGIDANTAWAGSIRNTIAWSNFVNYSGVGLGQLRSSNGSSLHPNNQNLDVDPLFVSPATRDLRLPPWSPCVERGDVATADLVQDDHDGGSRRSDAAVNGGLRPDLGCFEWRAWSLDLQGDGSLGATLGHRFTGPLGATGVLLQSLGGTTATFVPGYGWLSIGSPAEMVVTAILPVGTVFPQAIPALPALLGLPLHSQGIVVLDGWSIVGHCTQRQRVRLIP